MKRLDIANTLKKLAFSNDPFQTFYNSTVTSKMVEEIQSYGGLLTQDDFNNYGVKFGPEDRPGINFQLKEHFTICGPPPPSSASIVAAVMNVLDGYLISPEHSATVEANVELYHNLIESLKFALSAKQRMGDMDFEPDSLELAKIVTSNLYGDTIRSKILPQAQSEYYYDIIGRGFKDYGTSHLSVIDDNGNAVSLTSSINWPFGAKLISKSTGIIWNNEMDDFSQTVEQPAGTKNANFIEPGKRPMSSMSPVIIFDSDSGDVKLITGAAGGSRIVSSVAQILMNILYLNHTIKEAIDMPRININLDPLITEVESNFPLETITHSPQEFIWIFHIVMELSDEMPGTSNGAGSSNIDPLRQRQRTTTCLPQNGTGTPGEEDTPECALCLNRMALPVVVLGPCGHVFCTRCAIKIRQPIGTHE